MPDQTDNPIPPTDPGYWLDQMNDIIPEVPMNQKDYIAEYGVRLWDGEHWIRHFIDKPGGSVATLCGLACEFVPNQSQDVWKTCNACSAKQAELRAG